MNIGNDSNKKASIILDTSGKLVFKQSNDISGIISFGNLTDNSGNPAFVINRSLLPITDASGTRGEDGFTPSGKRRPNIDLGSAEHFFRHIYVSEGTIKFVTNKEKEGGIVEQLVTDAISMDSSTSRVKIAGALINGNLDISGDNSIIGNLEVNGNTIMHGDLTVFGNATTFSTTNTALKDTLIELSSGFTGEPINNSGLIINRGNEDNAFIGFDESDNKFILGTGDISGESIGNFSITPGTLKINNIQLGS